MDYTSLLVYISNVTLKHCSEIIINKFIEDLKDSIKEVRQNPSKSGGMAPIYGLGGSLPIKGMVNTLLKKYLDHSYRI